jgi:hypothetical protein
VTPRLPNRRLNVPELVSVDPSDTVTPLSSFTTTTPGMISSDLTVSHGMSLARVCGFMAENNSNGRTIETKINDKNSRLCIMRYLFV